MRPAKLNRWFKLLVIAWVIVIFVMLLIPSELTDEQLAQIIPGMTMAEVHRRIGKSNIREGWSIVAIGDPGDSKDQGTIAMWLQSERWLQPKVEAVIKETIKMNILGRISFWMGKSNMLWVENDQNSVLNVWIIPITKTGGGLQGCIDTIKQYWNDWRK